METKKPQGGKTPETGRENASSNKTTPNTTRNESTPKTGAPQRNEQPESGRERDRDKDHLKR